MRVCDCESPKLVYNKYTRKQVFVSCGKCVACRRKQTSQWIARMQQESKCHTYTFVLYLDYNDEHLPVYDLVDKQLVERNQHFYKVKNYKYPLCVPYDEFKFDSYSDFNYFARRGFTLGIPHPSVYDIQAFKKRLATYIAREVTGKYGVFRSCIAAEIGPTTHRPHYHGILYFDDERLAAQAKDKNGLPIERRTNKGEVFASSVINEIVRRAWSDVSGNPFGDAHARPDRGKSCSYVAKYIKRPTDLPSFYSHNALSPFFLSSRCPPIGSLLQSSSEIRWIFDNSACQRVTFSVEQGLTKVNVVPLGEAYSDKIFPKCPLYGEVPAYVRTELYKSVISNRGLYDSFGDYFAAIYERCVNGLYYGPNETNDIINLRFINGVLDFRETDFSRTIRRMTDDFTCLNSLLTLYRVGSRVWYQSQIFGVSFDEYLQHIYRYTEKLELYKLRMFYLSQDEYFKEFDIGHLPYWYPLTYFSLGYNPSDSIQCKLYVQESKLTNEKEGKTLKKNIYFESLALSKDPAKRNLFNLIKNFYNGKKCNETLEAFSQSWKE